MKQLSEKHITVNASYVKIKLKSRFLNYVLLIKQNQLLRIKGSRKMEIFQPIRDRLLVVGIVLYQKHPLNLRNLLTLFMLIMGSLLNCVHLFHEAITFKDFTDSFCASSSMIMATILFLILIWKTLSLYRYLNNLEECVTKRELNSLVCLD